MAFVSFNGNFVAENTPLVTADNPSFKWGDGLFETMIVLKGCVGLEQYHFERLQKGLNLLRIRYDDDFIAQINKNIYALCRQNNCLERGRVRLAVYRNAQGYADTIIQAAALSLHIDGWNEQGWSIGLYRHAIKSIDALSNLKTASYLPYILAANHARENGRDECLILNSKGNICDGSRTNLFIICNSVIYTPALGEGCVAGVMRRHVISGLLKYGMPVVETSITLKMAAEADEMFVTNAMIGIKWVQAFNDKVYTSKKVFGFYNQLMG